MEQYIKAATEKFEMLLKKQLYNSEFLQKGNSHP